MLQQGVLDLIRHRHLGQNLLHGRVDEVIQGGEHTHQIALGLGDRHILRIIHQLAAEVSPQEGALQEFLRPRIHLVFRIAGTEQINPLLQLPQAQGHNGLGDRGRPIAQGKIGGVHHFQQAISQAGVRSDKLLNLLHVWLVLGDGHHELEEIALDVGAAVSLGGKLIRHVGALQAVRPKGYRPLVQLLIVNMGDDALDIHAVGDLHRIADGDLAGALAIDFDEMDIIQQGQVPGRKLELVHRHPVALPDILLHQMHR